MRRLGGAGSPMAFGRSRGKMYAQEDLGVTFEDVAGIDEAVDELREVVEFLRTPEKYQILGGRIPKGLLLVGPPGTGKTLLAKAIAGEAGVPFFSLSGSDFVEMFVGVGAARVRDMFQQAEAKSPCIIFIDELDALGKTRGSSIVGGHDEREQTLNALLVEMDGFDSNSGVIVLAASNRPETLDPALLRPGRFDRHVLVDRPDVRGREAILKVHVQNVKLDENVNLKEVAAITSGFVGADLANLVNEGALLAARKGKTSVGMEEFNEGVERVTAGLEKRQRIIHEDEKLRVAYHEAGHALVAYSLPNTDPVHKVSIIPRGLAALGYTMQRPEGDRYLLTQGELESRIQVLLAGTCAEEMVFEDVSTGAQNDLERASGIARSMVMDFGMSRLGRVNYRESNRSPFLAGSDSQREHSHSEQTAREIDEEVKRIIDESFEKVRHILQSRMASLESLSARLIEKEVVDSDELKQIIEANSPSPQIVPGTSAERKRPASEGLNIEPGDQAGEA
jgi:cell division protease FtsH